MGNRDRVEVEVEVEVHPEQSLLILINHCREMKQQETRLRIATLLLLLSCAVICLYISCRHPAKVTSVSDPAFSAQKDPCPAGNPSTTRPLRIALRYNYKPNLTSGSYMPWENALTGENSAYTTPHAILIPESGIYFVYMWFELEFSEKNQELIIKLQSWSKRYNYHEDKIFIKESGNKTQEKFRTVYVGQLLDLSEGDHLKVFVAKGLDLINKASFGAFQT